MSTIKVFYNQEQTALTNKSFSPSAGKPQHVVDSWAMRGMPIEIVSFLPAEREAFCLAHKPSYVRQVLDCEASNGFGNTLEEVARTFPHTTGSMIAAAFHAAKYKTVAVSPTSGFHHAGYAHGGGFCTFNGLVVAAQMLRLYGHAKTVGIIDCDAHYGDGTEEIINKKNLKYIQHYTFGADSLSRKETSAEWLESFRNTVCEFKNCDVILYQAGADPHENDPLGGVLSSEQMRERDRIMFEFAHANGIPLAWNLAGGYQEPLRKVLDIHDATMEECVKVYLRKE